MTVNDMNDLRDEIQMLIFALDGVSYGVDVQQVREVKNFEGVTAVPSAPIYVKGVTNLRGEVISVIDLQKRFGLINKKDDSTKGTMIIVQGKHPVGVMVDSVMEVLTLSKADIESKLDDLSGVGSDAVLGFAQHEDRLIIVVDLLKIISNAKAD